MDYIPAGVKPTKNVLGRDFEKDLNYTHQNKHFNIFLHGIVSDSFVFSLDFILENNGNKYELFPVLEQQFNSIDKRNIMNSYRMSEGNTPSENILFRISNDKEIFVTEFLNIIDKSYSIISKYGIKEKK